MRQAAEGNSAQSPFFAEEKREVLSIAPVDHIFLTERERSFADVTDRYQNICGYYVIEQVQYREETEHRRSGEQGNLFLVAELGGRRYLCRISAVARETVEAYLK